MSMKWISISISFVLLCLTHVVGYAAVLNNPHAHPGDATVRYGAFAGPPKTLDPAKAFSSDEIQFIAQIYEPPLQYHLLKRPFTLIPLTAAAMPTVRRLRAQDGSTHVVYDITLQPGIYYQPHPALARNQAGQYRYLHLTPKEAARYDRLSDFRYTGTRALTAADYAYEIKRLADPSVNSPIFGIMSQYILGLAEYGKTLSQLKKKVIDLRQYPLAGVKVLGPYHYQIILKKPYPQFRYWLAMTFFAPIPWEAIVFYAQPGFKQKNISLDWYPIGTGPYLLAENNPNKQMVLARNPNFHLEKYPSEGTTNDREKGYLEDAGKPLPLVDKFIFSLDKESIPRWNKFLQGYYDKSGISADSFDQAIKIRPDGTAVLTPQMIAKGIQLQKTINPSIFYLGFNMLDPVVGGYSEKNKKLRQAIAAAIDYEEYIAIFMNGRGIPAQSPIPPGIFGYREGKAGINPIIYDWENNHPKRKSLAYAKKLLAEAGYPNGINPKTGRPLILNYDVTSTGNPDDQARLNWMRKQFAKLGIQLNIRSTQYNRFQDKVRTGNAQIFSWGWLADYPDPENFLSLLYGPNAKVPSGGENATNYHNPTFDRLFETMRQLPNGPARQALINQMIAMVQQDSPWVFGLHPIDFTLSHAWNRAVKPHAIANNTLKYEKLNAALRKEKREIWNQPILWPLGLLIGFLVVLMVPLTLSFWRRERRPTLQRK